MERKGKGNKRRAFEAKVDGGRSRKRRFSESDYVEQQVATEQPLHGNIQNTNDLSCQINPVSGNFNENRRVTRQVCRKMGVSPSHFISEMTGSPDEDEDELDYEYEADEGNQHNASDGVELSVDVTEDSEFFGDEEC